MFYGAQNKKYSFFQHRRGEGEEKKIAKSLWMLCDFLHRFSTRPLACFVFLLHQIVLWTTQFLLSVYALRWLLLISQSLNSVEENKKQKCTKISTKRAYQYNVSLGNLKCENKKRHFSKSYIIIGPFHNSNHFLPFFSHCYFLSSSLLLPLRLWWRSLCVMWSKKQWERLNTLYINIEKAFFFSK